MEMCILEHDVFYMAQKFPVGGLMLLSVVGTQLNLWQPY